MAKDDQTVLSRGYGNAGVATLRQIIDRVNAPDPTDDTLARHATGYCPHANLSESAAEVALMIAVVDEALDTLTCAGIPQATRHTAPFAHSQKDLSYAEHNRRKKQHDRELALRWFFADDGDDRYIYSFRNICETLGLDVNYLRRGVKVLIRRNVIVLRADEKAKYRVRRVLYRSAAVSLAKASP